MQSAASQANPGPELERALDSFDLGARQNALRLLCEQAKRDPKLWPPPKPILNLHCHTFYSYNACGYSPSSFAWRARKAGLAAAGVVDFDVLDALEEFLDAGRFVGLKTCVSLETRVFVPEFATRVINSPGEPGIAYHMGVGFTSLPQSDSAKAFLDSMRRTVEARNRDLVARVNTFTRPVELDYDRDVLPLTPKGNATERHICEAYERKAAKVFPDQGALSAFWKEKLGDCPADSAKLQALIRAKTMKRGGIGYVQPGEGSFPRMADMNRFVLECGAIPTLTWLDGTSDGEKAIEELFEIAKSTGAAALNIIPDRNYSPGQQVRGLIRDGGTCPAVARVSERRAHRLRALGVTAAERAGLFEHLGAEYLPNCRREKPVLRKTWPRPATSQRRPLARSGHECDSGTGVGKDSLNYLWQQPFRNSNEQCNSSAPTSCESTRTSLSLSRDLTKFWAGSRSWACVSPT
ncbi:MAG: hypothetical protein MUF81_02205 [Verrucomicrobia bacterium]|nr:hypothetical protein [Verrucomicrobiota bacterium]